MSEKIPLPTLLIYDQVRARLDAHPIRIEEVPGVVIYSPLRRRCLCARQPAVRSSSIGASSLGCSTSLAWVT